MKKEAIGWKEIGAGTDQSFRETVRGDLKTALAQLTKAHGTLEAMSFNAPGDEMLASAARCAGLAMNRVWNLVQVAPLPVTRATMHRLTWRMYCVVHVQAVSREDAIAEAVMHRPSHIPDGTELHYGEVSCSAGAVAIAGKELVR